MKFLVSFFFLLSFLNADDLIVKFLNLKKYYYKNQVVNLEVKIITPKEENLSFFLNSGDLNITKKPYIYTLNLKFKNDLNNTLQIVGEDINQTINLNSLYETKELEKIPNFCNVLAEDLKVVNPISTLINNKILLSFTIKVKNGNLKDFKLNREEKLTIIDKNEPTYYIYLPKGTKFLNFYYFNTADENFKKISVPIILKEETISTQTSINPEKDHFFEPVNILILSIIAFFLILFLVYQNLIILIFPILLSLYLLFNILPKGEKILKANSKVRILPTQTSTVFFIPKRDTKVKILNHTNHYTKIEINKKVGWVKDENLR